MTFDRPQELPPVVILSGIRWGFLWQRHQSIACCFAEAGYPTTFVETTGLSSPFASLRSAAHLAGRLRSSLTRHDTPGAAAGRNPRVYPPLVAPPTARVFRRLNERVMVPKIAREILAGMTDGARPVVVAYPPTETTMQIISALNPLAVHYDLADNYAAFSGVPDDIRETETRLLLRAESVSCTSHVLLERIRNLRPDAVEIGPGVDYDLFSSVRPDPTGKSTKKAGQPTVCYFGDITEERIDTGILAALAGAGSRVLLIGGVRGRARRILGVPGIEYRGEVPHRTLPHHLRDADVLVLPYRENTLTRSIAPAKLYECLATGLPTVSTPLPAVMHFTKPPLVYRARGEAEFLSAVTGVRETEDEGVVEARCEVAERNSWDRVFRRMEGVIWRSLARNMNSMR